ncbi:hypothetical protein Thimo_2624 [Thioflavicoccus mobilis 8321]|uniref:Tetratricopeptide repeat protein n=1 Tax=Thioflavicoccus mobilis 8321 TaxID=765912 RepID=L0H136_9GAMM|nr:hypothetical protein [Thioflavicoccus mobilis]AGA91345.1 hypothetical protein Thimo_2624 [Thioflavicoccus mobilis 8321]
MKPSQESERRTAHSRLHYKRNAEYGRSPRWLVACFAILLVATVGGCGDGEEPEEPRKANLHKTAMSGLISATDAESNAERALQSGQVNRAIDEWGRAAAFYAGIDGKEADSARCASNRARALAAIGRHEEAVRELLEAKVMFESIGDKGKIYHAVSAILHREQKLLEMVEKLGTQRVEQRPISISNSSTIRPQAAIVARMLLSDYGFRRSFLMDKAVPTSFPEQVKVAMGLNETELSALCLYGFRMHTKYHELLKKKYPFYLGATFDLSPGFRSAMGKDLEEAPTVIANTLEQNIGEQPPIEQ